MTTRTTGTDWPYYNCGCYYGPWSGTGQPPRCSFHSQFINPATTTIVPGALPEYPWPYNIPTAPSLPSPLTTEPIIDDQLLNWPPYTSYPFSNTFKIKTRTGKISDLLYKIAELKTGLEELIGEAKLKEEIAEHDAWQMVSDQIDHLKELISYAEAARSSKEEENQEDVNIDSLKALLDAINRQKANDIKYVTTGTISSGTISIGDGISIGRTIK